MLKETAAFDSLAEKRFTGIETRPKEIVAVPVGRCVIVSRFYTRRRDGFSIGAPSVADGGGARRV
jgi:hypothetical protein